MTDYFDKLMYVLQKNKLMDSPSQIYNVDEIGMPLDHRPPKIVSKRGQKKVRSRTSGNKSQVTVIACVGATGHVISFLMQRTSIMNGPGGKFQVHDMVQVGLTQNCLKGG